MSNAIYRSICLVSSIPFMLHSLCLWLGTWIFGFEWQLPIRVLCPRLGSAGVQITRRALDFFQRNLSHTGCRTTQTLTPHQRPCGGIPSRIRCCHIPSKFILITPAVSHLTHTVSHLRE